jgi:cellulose biosynthesis protein BcsQ
LVDPVCIPRSIAVAESQSFEKALIEYDPNGKAATAYRQVAEAFLARQISSDAGPAASL